MSRHSPVRTLLLIAALICAVGGLAALPAQGQPGGPERTPTFAPEPDASLAAISQAGAKELATALDLAPATLISASAGGSDPRALGVSTTPLAGMPRQGASYAVLSTGQAASAGLSNTSDSTSTILDGANNQAGQDLTQLTLELRPPADAACLSLDFVYLSEEFPEYVGSKFNDTFTVEVGGSDLQIVGSEVVAPRNIAFDTALNVISVNTVSGVQYRGSTYDGATSVLQVSTPVMAGKPTTLVLSVQDLGDSVYDSAVFIDNMRWSEAADCASGSELPPPLILVHGFSGLSDTDLYCDPDHFTQSDVVRYSDVRDSPTTAVEYWGPMPALFNSSASGGYDVWVAQLQTGKAQGTRSLMENGRCLADQIAYVYAHNPQPITLVAHSMGGLVSRSALLHPNIAAEVRALYTLGSPHAGLPASDLFYLGLEECAKSADRGRCDMSQAMMVYFNTLHRNQPGVSYTFIGGDASPSLSIYTGDDPHDGLVGRLSAIGLFSDGDFFPSGWAGDSPPRQIWTDEVHSGSFSGYNYIDRRQSAPSLSYACIIALEQGLKLPTFCRAGSGTAPATAASGSAQTAPLSGTLSAGQSISHELPIDGSSDLVVTMIGASDGMGLTLQRPDGVVVSPAYAAAHPAELRYEHRAGDGASAPLSRYTFLSPQPTGVWAAQVSAGASGGTYHVFASLQSPLTLAASLDAASYRPGESVTISAQLQSGAQPLAGATISAQVSAANGTTASVSLVDQGGGRYSATYSAPDAPGLLSVRVEASGSRDGVAWSRGGAAQAAIMPAGVSMGGYQLLPRNDNGDALFEALELRATAQVSRPGSYTLAASLEAQGALVAQASTDVALVSGQQALSLRFDGAAIRAAGRDGPYTLRSVALVERSSALPAASAEGAASLSGYGASSFGGCYSLTTTAVPTAGGTITVSPAPNCAGGTYSAGTSVTIAAKARSGYRLGAWQGAASGGAPTVSLSITGDQQLKAIFSPMKQVYLPLVRR